MPHKLGHKPLWLVPEPLNKRPQLLQLQQLFPGVEVQTQFVFRASFMNGVMTRPAHPQGSGDQIFFGEQFLEALLPMQVLGDKVVPGEPGNRAFAEFAIVWLGGGA